MACKHPMHDTDCPDGCAHPDPRCEWCGDPADEEREAKSGRVVFVCNVCGEDLDRAAERQKAADTEECRGDYERDSRKMEFDR